jgi:thiamine biosynthesis lipoprotein
VAGVIELGFDFTAMACPCELRVAGPDEARLRDAAAMAIAEVRRIEHKYSRYRDDSVVGRINAAAGGVGAVSVDDETTALLDFAGALYSQSGGLFDITSGVLRRAWDFRTGRVPSEAELQALLPLVGWPQVQRPPGAVRLPQQGMELDFGGFGKEYAADRAVEQLQRAGVKHGYANLGGDIRVLGPRGDGRPWRFAIRHPRVAEACVAEVELSGGALATSGDYERSFERDGRRYHHLLDPRTGWPVRRWQSVSVVAPTCAGAGALCTIAMLLEDEAEPFLQAQGVWHLALDGRAASPE